MPNKRPTQDGEILRYFDNSPNSCTLDQTTHSPFSHFRIANLAQRRCTSIDGQGSKQSLRQRNSTAGCTCHQEDEPIRSQPTGRRSEKISQHRLNPSLDSNGPWLEDASPRLNWLLRRTLVLVPASVFMLLESDINKFVRYRLIRIGLF